MDCVLAAMLGQSLGFIRFEASSPFVCNCTNSNSSS
jgi:hypothetical protein